MFYQFDIVAVDNGVPEKSSTAEVVIKVQRDEEDPEYADTPYTVTAVPENKDVGEKVFQVKARDEDLRVGLYCYRSLYPVLLNRL